MKLPFEYGAGLMAAELPDNTDVFIPDETVVDPPCIPEDQLVKKTPEFIRNPMGVELLSRLVHEDFKVTIVFLDRIKGGEQPTSHRKISIKLIPKELYGAGVEKEDIPLICSSGLRRKNTRTEIHNTLGDELFHEFRHTYQIISRDSGDYEHLVSLGTMDRGDPVLMNKHVYDSDATIPVGRTQGNPYGGYSGGYKYCAMGIAHWRSIVSHHTPEVIHRKDFTPVSGTSLMRTKFGEIGQYMGKYTREKFFRCDTVLDARSRQVGINSEYAKVIQSRSWITADKKAYMSWAEEKYGVMVLGMPQFSHYDEDMGTNPIMLMQAISAQVIRHERITSDNCAIICPSLCNGCFRDELWSYTRKVYETFQHDFMNTPPGVGWYDGYFTTSEEYIRKYRYCNAFHPFYGFPMISCGRVAETNTSAIYLCGIQGPGYTRGTGLRTRTIIEEALTDAREKFVG